MEIRARGGPISFGARRAARRTLDSYTRNGGLPTDAGRARVYSRCMTEKYLFADVDLPFHVWVKEGGRWVLRDAGQPGAGPSFRAEPGTSSSPRPGQEALGS